MNQLAGRSGRVIVVILCTGCQDRRKPDAQIYARRIGRCGPGELGTNMGVEGCERRILTSRHTPPDNSIPFRELRACRSCERTVPGDLSISSAISSHVSPS